MIRKARFPFVLILPLLVAAPASMSYCKKQPSVSQTPDRRYNVVVIVPDALRADALSCYGGEADTPNIDWLAENGAQFLNAYATSPWTSPSSVSLLTGYYASIFEVGKRELITDEGRHFKPAYFVPDSITTLPEALAGFGYDVCLQHNNHNAVVSNSFQGFRVLGRLSNEEQDRIVATLNIDDSLIHTGGSVSPLIDFIFKSGGRPFFSIIWLADPHSPYNPVEKYYNRIRFNRSELPRPTEYYSSHENFHTWEYEATTETEQKYIRELYLAEVESVDERVGHVIKALQHSNLLEKTYIILTSDHGEAFGEHGYYSHATSFYEQLLRVPLIYYGPDVQKTLKITTTVSNISLMPTLKELLGASYHEASLGESYAPLLQGKALKPRALYYDGLHKYVPLKTEFIDAIRINDYKLITLEPNEFELYDVAKDPDELENLAAESPGLVREMFREIMKIRNDNTSIQGAYFKPSDLNKTEQITNRDLIERLKALGYIK